MAKDDLKSVRQRKYLAKDFDGMRAQLLEYARLYYPNKIRDFSESSMGGLLLDFAAYVGDNLSFYLDHQFSELNADSAVETINVERALKSSGVPIVGASPAIVPLTIYIQVPVEIINNVQGPMTSVIPIIQSGSIFSSDDGVDFILVEDIDFNKKRTDGNFVAELKVGQIINGNIQTYIMAASGVCVSGNFATEQFNINSTFVPFRQITLSNSNVSDIVSVVDDFGNSYYEVGSLNHDVVYRNVLNTAKDNDIVKDTIKVIPVPYRYISSVDLSSRQTVLTFGGGNADTLEDDIIPDPSDFAISLPYSKTFSRLPINPQQLLRTKTLGVATTNTVLSVTYRHGGGLFHNAAVDTIKTIKVLKLFFPKNPAPGPALFVRNSIEVSNLIEASGGDDAPTNDELKQLIPSIKSSQERIVTREDLISRVYTLPANFGRIFRASVRSNPNNPLATQLYIISRNANSELITSPDSLKQNLVSYLNPYRMISDAIDILDASVINLKFTFDVLVDPSLNKTIVLQSVLTDLQSFFNIKNFHIDQPIIMSDIVNIIFTTKGILSITDVKFENITGTENNRKYSNTSFNIDSNMRKGILFPPGGAIFEVKYPEFDIIGKATF